MKSFVRDGQLKWFGKKALPFHPLLEGGWGRGTGVRGGFRNGERREVYPLLGEPYCTIRGKGVYDN